MNKNNTKLLNTDLLHTFTVIAECQNLTHAAAQLNRTQSAISVKLRKLEENIGVALFVRQSSGMILNDNGKKLLPIANRTLEELTRIDTLFQPPLTGHINIGIPDDFNGAQLERALVEFKSRNPGVEVNARSGCTTAYPDAIKKEELDIAVCSGPEVIEGEFLSSEASVWVCSESLNVQPEDTVPLAILDRSCWWKDVPINALNNLGRSWKVAYTTESFFSLHSAIRAGFAIGVLPIGSVKSGMRILSTESGFPTLPAAKRTILRGTSLTPDLMDSMADAIRRAVILRSPEL